MAATNSGLRYGPSGYACVRECVRARGHASVPRGTRRKRSRRASMASCPEIALSLFLSLSMKNSSSEASTRERFSYPSLSLSLCLSSTSRSGSTRRVSRALDRYSALGKRGDPWPLSRGARYRNNIAAQVPNHATLYHAREIMRGERSEPKLGASPSPLPCDLCDSPGSGSHREIPLSLE